MAFTFFNPSMLIFTRQSPVCSCDKLKTLLMSTSLLSLEYLHSSILSYGEMIFVIKFNARPSPQRWIRLARIPSTTFVQAKPRYISAIICISSTTATSYSSSNVTISIVALTRLDVEYSRYCPVKSVQLPSFCCIYHANSRRGAK